MKESHINRRVILCYSLVVGLHYHDANGQYQQQQQEPYHNECLHLLYHTQAISNISPPSKVLLLVVVASRTTRASQTPLTAPPAGAGARTAAVKFSIG